MNKIKLYTIGFAKKSAEYFFEQLRERKVKRVIDIRLNNTSQLAGFAKKDDLRYFLLTIDGIDYVHRPEWAPTQEIFDNFKKNKGGWACLLCSEDTPDHCHRRLVAEYLEKKFGDMEIIHLV